MRICFSTTGDIESLATLKRATGMAAPLTQKGHQVAIVAWDTPNNRKRFVLECPKTEILWVPNNLSPLRERREKYRLVKKWNPEILYVCAFGMRNGLTRFGVPKHVKVIVEHSELPSGIPRGFISRQKERFFEWLSVFAADGLLCASQFLEDYFKCKAKKWFRASLPICYHPYAYNPNILAYQEGKLLEVKKIKNNRKMLMYMGTLAKNYGILDLLRGVQLLSVIRKDFSLHIMGRGRHAAEARQLAEELKLGDFVSFHGYVPEEDLGAWFSQSDVFLMPIYDTVQDKARCPSKVYMYLPFQKPVVTNKIGDPFHVLSADGFYYQTGNPQDLCRVLNQVLDMPSWTPKNVDATRHTWEARSEEFLSWIKKI